MALWDRALIQALKDLAQRIKGAGRSPSDYSLVAHIDSQLLVGQVFGEASAELSRALSRAVSGAWKVRQVMVVGRLRPDPETGGPRIFTRQDGTVGATYEVIADRVVFLGSRGEDDGVDLPPDAPEGEDIPF